MINYADIVKFEMTGIYGERALADLNDIIRLYNIYDGAGQTWETPNTLNYKPTKITINFTKKLINNLARFLFGKPPEIKLLSKNKEAAEALQQYIDKILEDNSFSEKLIRAARDCLIGKRIAIKITGFEKGKLNITFRPSMEFLFETMDDNIDELKKIVFFYCQNDNIDKKQQRIFKQKYEMIKGKCILNEGIYDGYGKLVEDRYTNFDTRLDFIPARVIINDGISNDLFGESEVEKLEGLQEIYNKLMSDIMDMYKSHMFPQTVVRNATEECVEKIVTGPSVLIDLQPDPSMPDKEPNISKLESHFSHSESLENTLDRIKSDMHELLSIPNLSLEHLRGFGTSAKGMKAIYWELVIRCEEKFTTWRPALKWLIKSIFSITKAYSLENIYVPDDIKINIENIYPLMEDEFEEKALDLQMVHGQVMSRKSNIKKWNKNVDDDAAEQELKQIAIEKSLDEEVYISNMDIDK